MKVFRYWAAASQAVQVARQTWTVRRFAGSDVSVDAAQTAAAERVREAARAIEGGAVPDQYAYADRPLREELVNSSEDGGAARWAITRNAYGSLILNTSNVLFADIDLPSGGASGGGGGLGRLFGRRKADPGEAIVARVASVAHAHPELGMRLYRTAAGYRCLVTSDVYEPTAPDTLALLDELGSDPLYVKLCRTQESFRARLTPKYWRCGGSKPPNRYPWATDDAELAYREWETAYHERADGFATCESAGTYGSERLHPAAAAVRDVHDEMACRPAAQLA